MISSFGGDNSTTLTNCPLNNWLSKAFIDKGADCYLSFLGVNATTVCTSCPCSNTDDVYSPYVDDFNTCFWGNVSVGDTILTAKNKADTTSCVPQTCGPSNNESCAHPLLVERFLGSCSRTLIK